ncbi:Putative acyl-CoA thioesterase, HotDog domain superfamily [Septoria linicola]|uniref:Acyl-CoA thioesterase, HotDog domain superfamily n=1 Tax=Septoria linicola TaxID=215465 RepID=A0A9Q9AI77_9PEZI|nr:putative acyl-CoA thioesterase, HotDog domain superfamily [Septoria linicola]USW47393.1 Putative acyl-CoA thioesterase, HotDog domain superfamily [Septoria linicola]
MSAGRGGQPTRVTDLPPHEGNTYLPFAKLIDLEKIDDRTFRSIAPAFAPGGPVGVGRSYGAHVYMQAAWAASQTVAPGFQLHNVSGNFILAGELNVPFVYKVHIIRNGRSYCTRIVNVTQSQGKGICFTCICSFKTPEHEQINSQNDVNLYREYASVLGDKKPSDFPEVPGMDLPFYWKRRQDTGLNDEFPGLECRKVDMSAFNASRHPLERKQLIFYRTIGELADEPNMHLCAHLFASDRNSLYIVANHYELGDYFTSMSSLVHTVIIHSPAAALTFGAANEETSPLDDKSGRWFCMEASGSRMSGGRAVYNCRIWNSKGEHVATAMQDGLIRYAQNPKQPTDDELKHLDAKARKWSGGGRDEKL